MTEEIREVDLDKSFASAQLVSDMKTIGEQFKAIWHSGTLAGRYFTAKGKFMPTELSSDIQKQYSIITMQDNLEIYIYNEKEGIYQSNGKNRLRAIIKKVLNSAYRERYATEVIHDITASTQVDREIFNQPLHLIPVQNGILDIKTMKLKPFTKNHHFVNKLPVAFDSNAENDRWLDFIYEVLRPQDHMFMQEWFGYCLLRQIIWHIAIMLVGPTRTGKSTLIYVLTKLFGDNNVCKIPVHDLGRSFQRVHVYQKYLNAYADISSEELKDDSYLKILISGDPVTAEFKYVNSFMFYPYAKHIFSCNQLPYVYEDSGAFYERWYIVVMNLHQFFDGNKDTDKFLKQKLTTPKNLSGILNWALEGLQRLLKQQEFTNKLHWTRTREMWLMHSDPLSKFMESDWVVWKDDETVTKEDFYLHFVQYCTSIGVTAWTKERLGRAMYKRYVDKDILQVKRVGKDMCWKGIVTKVKSSW